MQCANIETTERSPSACWGRDDVMDEQTVIFQVKRGDKLSIWGNVQTVSYCWQTKLVRNLLHYSDHAIINRYRLTTYYLQHLAHANSKYKSITSMKAVCHIVEHVKLANELKCTLNRENKYYEHRINKYQYMWLWMCTWGNVIVTEWPSTRNHKQSAAALIHRVKKKLCKIVFVRTSSIFHQFW